MVLIILVIFICSLSLLLFLLFYKKLKPSLFWMKTSPSFYWGFTHLIISWTMFVNFIIEWRDFNYIDFRLSFFIIIFAITGIIMLRLYLNSIIKK